MSGSWFKILKQVFENNQGKIFWNPGASQLAGGLKKLQPFFKKTYCLMLNRDEAIELILSSKKITGNFLDKMDNLLEIIKAYGPKIVAITDGNQGAYFYDGSNFYHQKIVKEKKHVDTTGIGDVYNSTFSAGLLFYNGDIIKAARLASRNAASKIAHLGAQNGLLSKKELMK